MKKNWWQDIVLWVILILSTAWIVFFLVSSRRQHNAEISNPETLQQDSIRITRITIDNPSIDFGRVSRDTLLKADITIKITLSFDFLISRMASIPFIPGI